MGIYPFFGGGVGRKLGVKLGILGEVDLDKWGLLRLGGCLLEVSLTVFFIQQGRKV